MRLRYLLLVIFSMMTSCSPTAPLESTLRVLSVSMDTLYGEEAFTIQVNQGGLDPSELRLFVHTVEFPIEHVDGQTIHAIAKSGASGRVRLYHRNVESEGDLQLVVEPLTISQYFYSLGMSISPMEGKHGDTINVYNSVHYDLEELDLRVNNRPFKKLGLIGQYLQVIVPDDMTDGWLMATLNGHRSAYGFFDVRDDNETFLERGTMTRISLFLSTAINAIRTDSGGVESKKDLERIEIEVSSPAPIQIESTDYLRIDYKTVNGNEVQAINMALHYDKNTRLVSGTLLLVESETSRGLKVDTVILKFKDMPWRKEHGRNFLYVDQGQVAKSIESIEYRSIDHSKKTSIRLVALDFEKITPSMYIMLTE